MGLFSKNEKPGETKHTLPSARSVTLTGECPDPGCGRQLSVTMYTLAPPSPGGLSTSGSCPDCGLPIVVKQ